MEGVITPVTGNPKIDSQEEEESAIDFQDATSQCLNNVPILVTG